MPAGPPAISLRLIHFVVSQSVDPHPEELNTDSAVVRQAVH